MNAPLPEIRDQARNKWTSILQMLGLDQSFLRNRHGPCPLCDGRDRFRFDDQDGRGTWICNQCGAGDGMELALRFTGMSFADCAKEIRERLGEAVERKPKDKIDPEQARRACQLLWRGSIPVFDDEAGAYLRSRGFVAPFPPQVLRFHPAAEVSDHPTKRTMPALLARVSDNAGDGVNIHRTYLENGRKARWTPRGETVEAACRRLMPGELPADAAIRLVPHDGILGVAEGVETAMAVIRDFGIPCWSLINSTHMGRWRVPDDVRELHIFGDADPKYGGQAAAWQLAHRTACRRNPPIVHQPRIPDQIGTDWADQTRELEAA
jgi:putative DNA primase/helicase